jgi:hypothetical protein
MSEGSKESSCTLFGGQVDHQEWVGNVTESKNGFEKFDPDAKDAIELRFGVSVKSLGARPICVHEVSLETMSLGVGKMEKLGGIW